jgi:hypothetical protein
LAEIQAKHEELERSGKRMQSQLVEQASRADTLAIELRTTVEEVLSLQFFFRFKKIIIITVKVYRIFILKIHKNPQNVFLCCNFFG